MVGVPEYWTKEDLFNAYELDEFNREQRKRFENLLKSNQELSNQREFYENLMKFLVLLRKDWDEIELGVYEFIESIIDKDDLVTSCIDKESKYAEIRAWRLRYTNFLSESEQQQLLDFAKGRLNPKEFSLFYNVAKGDANTRSVYRLTQFGHKLDLEGDKFLSL